MRAALVALFAGALLGGAGEVAPRADAVAPLAVGAKVPDAPIRTASGGETTLHAVTGQGVVALVFYRGGW